MAFSNVSIYVLRPTNEPWQLRVGETLGYPVVELLAQ